MYILYTMKSIAHKINIEYEMKSERKALNDFKVLNEAKNYYIRRDARNDDELIKLFSQNKSIDYTNIIKWIKEDASDR